MIRIHFFGCFSGMEFCRRAIRTVKEKYMISKSRINKEEY